VALELNAHPHRLDLRDTHLIRARELGISIVISTDAHTTRDLDYMRYGVEQARRAGLEAGDVLNTRPLPELQRFLTRQG
jgi:DNA polymerase (family 10)